MDGFTWNGDDDTPPIVSMVLPNLLSQFWLLSSIELYSIMPLMKTDMVRLAAL